MIIFNNGLFLISKDLRANKKMSKNMSKKVPNLSNFKADYLS